jgi:hypothetical protein
MSRKTTKVALVNGRRMRITRLDSCGRVVYGDDNVAISSGFVSIASKTATTSTNAVEVKNANGEKIVNVPAKTNFTGFTLTIVFGEVDPELFALVTGQSVVFDAFGNPVGFDINTDVSLTSQGIAIEVWTGSPTTDACLDPNAKGAFGYVLLPFLQGGYLGDYSIAEGGINFTIDAIASYDGNHWGHGPYKVQLGSDGQPSTLIDALPTNAHSRTFITGVVPPDATVGTRPQLDPAATAITTIMATPGTGHAVDFTATPAVAAGVGTWWDFGDGEWDYVTTAGSAVSHTYAAAGTYNVTASTNGTWISKSTTVS